jgi:hypothetical protein
MALTTKDGVVSNTPNAKVQAAIISVPVGSGTLGLLTGVFLQKYLFPNDEQLAHLAAQAFFENLPLIMGALATAAGAIPTFIAWAKKPNPDFGVKKEIGDTP